MDESINKFFNNETNVIPFYNKGGEIIAMYSKDMLPNNIECRYLNAIDGDKQIPMQKPFYHNRNKNIMIDENEKPKSMGGKKPYIMVMINEIEELRGKGVKNVEELIGYVACLGNYIEWNTGKLIHKRNKKPIRYNDLQAIYGCGNKKLNKMINLMKEHNLLYHNGEGYFISSKYIKKGKSLNK